MRLTPKEYRRGLLSWDNPAISAVKTSTSEVPGEPPVWSEPLTDPAGSRVLSPPHRYVAIAVSAESPPTPERPHRIRWERLFDDTIVTSIWGGARTVKLFHVPDYGFFHRLVVTSPTLGWPEDAVIRHGNVVIRLIEGRVRGERVEPMDQVQTEGDKIILSGGAGGEAEAVGRFIEIVAPGDSPDAAEQLAEALLGCVAVCLGENAVGDLIFSEPHAASAERQTGMHRIPVTAAIPRMASRDQVDFIDRALPVATATDDMARARRLALRWYGRGLGAATPLDSFLSFFVGIEAIANTYASVHGPIPERVARENRLAELLRGLAEPVDRETQQWLRGGLLRPPLADNFRFYVQLQALDETLNEQFRELRELRNDIVHGRVAALQRQHAHRAQELLGRLLGSELAITAATDPADLPLIEGLTVHYELATAEKLGERGDEAANPDNAPRYYSGQIDTLRLMRLDTFGSPR